MKAAASLWEPGLHQFFLKFSVSVSSFKQYLKTSFLNEHMINDFIFMVSKKRLKVYKVYIKRYISNV